MAKSNRKRRRKWIFWTLLVLAAAGLALAAVLRKKEVLVTIQTETVQRRDLTELVVANGKIQPVIQVVINPEVAGEIVDLPVEEGQRVRKGDVLVRIRQDNYQASHNSAKASYQSALADQALAQANLRKAELEYERFRKLYENKLVSDSELLAAQTTMDVAKASSESSRFQVEQAQATVARAADDLAKTTIVAPMDGTVTRLRSQKGERVVGTSLMAGTEIMTIANLETMEARVDIGEIDIVLVKLGQPAHLEIDAFRDAKFSGVVTEIANAAKGLGPAGGTSSQEATKFEVKIRIQEKEEFRPGMSVTAEIETRHRTNVLTVPIQSVTTRLPKPASTNSAARKETAPTNAAASTGEGSPRRAEGGKPDAPPKPIEVVFVVEGDHVVQSPVARGISDDYYVEITRGLQEGQEVVSGGYKAINRELEDGKKVKRGPPEPEKKKS